MINVQYDYLNNLCPVIYEFLITNYLISNKISNKK